MKSGPIILVEDDLDDQELISDALKLLKVPNEIITFDNGQQALEFLKNTDKQPFMIISDVNLPVKNGLQLKNDIESSEYLKSKAIPFIFLSTSAEASAVEEAYHLCVQGFFVKEISYEAIQQQLKLMIDYWKNCKHPNFKE